MVPTRGFLTLWLQASVLSHFFSHSQPFPGLILASSMLGNQTHPPASLSRIQQTAWKLFSVNSPNATSDRNLAGAASIFPSETPDFSQIYKQKQNKTKHRGGGKTYNTILLLRRHNSQILCLFQLFLSVLKHE